nr:MAG TPA: hypothetical protein [Caudoviricetes sp.]
MSGCWRGRKSLYRVIKICKRSIFLTNILYYNKERTRT